MTNKQTLYFNIIFPIYVSVVLGFFMTWGFVGFNEHFIFEYILAIIVGIVVTTPLGFRFGGKIAEATFKSNPTTGVEHFVFHMNMTLLMTCFVTLVTVILNNFRGVANYASAPAFFSEWMSVWFIAATIGICVIHPVAPKIQAIVIKNVK